MLAHQTPSQASQQHLTTSMKSEVPSGVRQRERRTGWVVQVAGVLKPTSPKLELRQQRLLLQSKANTSQGNRGSPRTTERVEQKRKSVESSKSPKKGKGSKGSKKKGGNNASGKELINGLRWIAENYDDLKYKHLPSLSITTGSRKVLVQRSGTSSSTITHNHSDKF